MKVLSNSVPSGPMIFSRDFMKAVGPSFIWPMLLKERANPTWSPLFMPILLRSSMSCFCSRCIIMRLIRSSYWFSPNISLASLGVAISLFSSLAIRTIRFTRDMFVASSFWG